MSAITGRHRDHRPSVNRWHKQRDSSKNALPIFCKKTVVRRLSLDIIAPMKNRIVFLILLALLTACAGAEGEPGPAGEACQVDHNEDGSYTIDCPGDSPVTIRDGATGPPGPAGQDGQSCTATDNGDGSYTINCPGNSPITIRDGDDGLDGQDGQNAINADVACNAGDFDWPPDGIIDFSIECWPNGYRKQYTRYIVSLSDPNPVKQSEYTYYESNGNQATYIQYQSDGVTVDTQTCFDSSGVTEETCSLVKHGIE